MGNAVIVSAKRTPVGKFGGALKEFGPGELGAHAVKAALAEAGVNHDEVDSVIMGNVLSAGHGQNVARQASIWADIPHEVPAFSVNKVCGSGLKSVELAAQSIMLGDSEVAIAGGCESMSTSPYALKNVRWGETMGNDELVDLMINDGLWDKFNDYHMGLTAENVAEKWDVSREEQDHFAANSQNKAEAAIKTGKFKDEIAPVELPQKKGDPKMFEDDEFPRFGTTHDSLSRLKPAFKKDGTVTAGNSSGINDGAAAVLLMSEEKAKEKNIEPLATIVGYGACGVAPEIMGIGPVGAAKKALERAGISIEDLDLIEVNEAFASQSVAVLRELKLDTEKVNVNGGAIALGHPIGATGTRILVTLLHELKRRNGKYGMATLCIGGGQGVAIIVRRDNNGSSNSN